MNNFLYNICGCTELRLKKSAIDKMDISELLKLMIDEQNGKIKIIVID